MDLNCYPESQETKGGTDAHREGAPKQKAACQNANFFGPIRWHSQIDST